MRKMHHGVAVNFHISVNINPLAETPDKAWIGTLNANSVTAKNVHAFGHNPIQALTGAIKNAEVEGLITHNPTDNEDCYCSMCSY